MNPLELVRLTSLMERTAGLREIALGLIDGPVMIQNPGLSTDNIREVNGKRGGACSYASSTACRHGTFVAGILSARRGGDAPAICPGCTLILRPIFSEGAEGSGDVPEATPDELADAIGDSIAAGARVLNMSIGLSPSTTGESRLQEALDHAAKRGVIAVAAAGNHASVGSSIITRHPWVIPVTSCDLDGRLSPESNIGISIGRRGLSAPGQGVTSLGTDGSLCSLRGTSAATPFVTGAAALLWSEFPDADPVAIKAALTHPSGQRRRSLVPPILNVSAAWEFISANRPRGECEVKSNSTEE
jgi:subtilisin family serine protease